MTASPSKFKVVVQKPAGGAEAYAIEREALDPIGAAIVEVDAKTEADFEKYHPFGHFCTVHMSRA